jgi:hypothetical protein
MTAPFRTTTGGKALVLQFLANGEIECRVPPPQL